MNKGIIIYATVLGCVTIWCQPASAVNVPFTEDFTTGASHWRNSTSTSDLDWVESGGPNGGPYASTVFNYVDSAANDMGGPPLFRASASAGASGLAFKGDWIGDGVVKLTAMVRHDGPSALPFFVRFATPPNFPAVVGVHPAPVFPNTWTKITVEIDPNNPLIIPEPPGTFASVMANIGNLQIGTTVPEAIAGVDQDIRFDIDKVTILNSPIVPTASHWAVAATSIIMLVAAVAFVRSRRVCGT